ncbi:hypothetical protein HanHA89_Chr06g0218171 [Helianthus annuus]|nr:hypothetical protein HanHA89_Chr06g0218171 [Helianthus annuus]
MFLWVAIGAHFFELEHGTRILRAGSYTSCVSDADSFTYVNFFWFYEYTWRDLCS